MPQTMPKMMMLMPVVLSLWLTMVGRSAPSDTSRYRGLDDSIDDEDLRAFFSQFGTVTGVAQHRSGDRVKVYLGPWELFCLPSRPHLLQVGGHWQEEGIRLPGVQ